MTSRWVKIDRKVNLLAVVAFLFSLVGALPQIAGWLKGSDLVLLQPPQVEIFHKGDLLRVSTDMAYVNRGLTQYGGLVKEERVEFQLPDPANNDIPRMFTFHWVAFLQTKEIDDPTNLNAVEEVESRIADAHPFVVHGGDGAAHHTAFFARQVQCATPNCSQRNVNFYSWANFKRLLAQEKIPTIIEFAFLADHDGESSLKQVCKVVLDQKVKRWLNETVIAHDEIIQLPCYQANYG